VLVVLEEGVELLELTGAGQGGRVLLEEGGRDGGVGGERQLRRLGPALRVEAEQELALPVGLLLVALEAGQVKP
jgi:hypothetical protein